MRVCGIDTGINGGIAFYEIEEGNLLGTKAGAERVIDIVDIPTIDDDGPHRYVDARTLMKLLRAHSPEHVFMESVRAIPSFGRKGKRDVKMGAVSAMNFGDARGSIRATVMCFGRSPALVEPQAWKKAFGLVGPDKEQSRLKALARLPKAAPYLKRKMDHGRAEALLVAIYGAAKLMQQTRAARFRKEVNMRFPEHAT